MRYLANGLLGIMPSKLRRSSPNRSQRYRKAGNARNQVTHRNRVMRCCKTSPWKSSLETWSTSRWLGLEFLEQCFVLLVLEDIGLVFERMNAEGNLESARSRT